MNYLSPLFRDIERELNLRFPLNISSFFDDETYAYGRRPRITENENGYVIELDLPGFKQTDLDLELEDGEITISAKRGESAYKQSFILPRGIDPDKVDAKLEDGILTILLAKLASFKPRKVTVK